MQTGRNQPCPCGSKRKYKHCCINNAAQPASTVSKTPMSAPFRVPQTPAAPQLPMPNNFPVVLEDEDFDDDDDDRDFDLLSSFGNIMYSLRDLQLRKISHVKAYKKLRKLHGEVINAMAAIVNEGKFTLKFDQEKKDSDSPEHLLYFEADYDLNTNDGEHAYYDMFIYKLGPNSISLTDEFLRTNRYRKPEKVAMLQAMQDSVCGLFEIMAIDENQAYVLLKEVFTGQEFTIVDIGMSMQDSVIGKYIHRRIITVEDISFTTGPALTFDADDAFILDFIKRHKKDYHPFKEIIRFNELYNQHTKNPDKIKTQVFGVR